MRSASALLIGLCYIFYTVAVQNLIGSIGEGHERTRNYSIFSIGVGLTHWEALASGRPPMPVGPSILWEEQVKKSQSSAWTSVRPG